MNREQATQIMLKVHREGKASAACSQGCGRHEGGDGHFVCQATSTSAACVMEET